jgi:hypothetical protein
MNTSARQKPDAIFMTLPPPDMDCSDYHPQMEVVEFSIFSLSLGSSD